MKLPDNIKEAVKDLDPELLEKFEGLVARTPAPPTNAPLQLPLKEICTALLAVAMCVGKDPNTVYPDNVARTAKDVAFHLFGP